ncbi:hypothetical protein UYA_09520 [Ectopseudomonas alcaliphila JAB1]|nr:hypothetical protein [Pseudomonas alcaliphila]APU29956.1 hypothetical protein UYA_09520 [Pseudomonas alcaliphila JAB1]
MDNPVLPAGWMLEQASDYMLAAQHLAGVSNMLRISEINAALGVEILLKSFLAKPDGNHGQINETYKVDSKLLKRSGNQLKALGKLAEDAKPSGHDLLLLLNAIPLPVQQAAGLSQHKEIIERYRYTFTSSRYVYEKKATRGTSDILLGRAVEMLYSAMAYARDAGSTDPVVKSFPDGRAAPARHR